MHDPKGTSFMQSTAEVSMGHCSDVQALSSFTFLMDCTIFFLPRMDSFKTPFVQAEGSFQLYFEAHPQKFIGFDVYFLVLFNNKP